MFAFKMFVEYVYIQFPRLLTCVKANRVLTMHDVFHNNGENFNKRLTKFLPTKVSFLRYSIFKILGYGTFKER